MTTAEYLQTPETVLPRELVYGVLRAADAPRTQHQRAVFRIARALAEHVEHERLGEVLIAPIDVVLDADRALIVQPDIVFISKERADILTDRIYGAPDVAIEVLSPHPRIGSIHERIDWFARYGVRECWLWDLAGRSVTVLDLAQERVVLHRRFDADEPMMSGVVPEFRKTFAEVVGR
jgi:Uma2 family endonuclease